MTNQASTASLYECRVRHIRLSPLRYGFSHPTYQWFVDVDQIPRPAWPVRIFAGIRASDHLGDPSASIRSNIMAFLAKNGIELSGGKIWMLTHAKVLGYVFNPLTVYWCHDDSGRLSCIVAEVHNTYGQQHCYLLRPDANGSANAVKRFYVSPFFDVNGRYRMWLPEPRQRLQATICLEQSGRNVFTASLSGRRKQFSSARLLSMAIRYPLSTMAVSAAIRWHGIRLYLRGLKPRPRPTSQGNDSRDFVAQSKD